ncbi:hypothetical protein ACFLRZ_05275 [Bacteroidota bacterium]
MRNPFEEEHQENNKRPDLLSLLCILTFIGSGLGFISNLFVTLSYNTLVETIENGELPAMYDMIIDNMTLLLSGGVYYFMLSFLFFGTSLFGAIFMWQLRRMGFHIYTISQILILILPALFLQGQGISILSFFFTGLFIGLYAINLKVMK